MTELQRELPTLDELSLAEKIAQLIFVRIGSNLPPIITVSEDEERVESLLAECPIGGLLLFNGQWPSVATTLERLQRASRIPLLVGADLERGAGQQIAELTVFPHAAAFGQCGQAAEQLVQDAAATTAREAIAAGSPLVFGPIADVSTNPKNPIIATRAFAQTPAEAARFAAASIDGLQAAGAFATAKHFPGHGDTLQDSHAELPTVDRPLEELQEQELPPFREAIAAGVSTIMTAHVRYPAIAPTGMPASFSAPILRGLLREELGFQGVVCSDSLLMEGARIGFDSEGAMAAAAIHAGVDLLLDVANPAEVVMHVQGEIDAGRLDESLIDEAVDRILALKKRIPAATDASPISNESLEAGRKLSARVARSAVSFFSGADNRPTLSPGKSVCVVLFKPFNLPTDPPEQPLATAVRERFAEYEYRELGPQFSAEVAAEVRNAAAAADQVLLAIIAKPAAWHAFGMTDAQRQLANHLTKGENVVVASLGVPTILADFPERHTKVCTYSDVPASQMALIEVLRGDHSAAS
ncbi:MAG: glycoside hydrolase family 3 N-terminal domain-containing protein [Planctomycetota bacterium]